MLDWMQSPHRRRNPLTGEWILVSPQRALRPWQGQVEVRTEPIALAYDPQCYLCPGNERAGGVRNPPYPATFVFDNDFPAIVTSAQDKTHGNDLLRAEAESGICRVMCFSPRHDLSLSSMKAVDIENVVATWCTQLTELRALPWIRHVQIFENRGAVMGASNPHPHCQIWATASIPDQICKETDHQLTYLDDHGSCLLCDYAALEQDSEREVVSNNSFIAVVPFWATWPFEVLVISTRHVAGMAELGTGERQDLASILKEVTKGYDQLFDTPFPYTMGFHQRPSGIGNGNGAWHFHAHFYPPLLRSATVRKFMVGFELLAGAQRDLTPEAAAQYLRAAREKRGK